VEQRTRDAIQNIVNERDSLIGRIDEHIDQEQTKNRYENNIFFVRYSSIYLSYL